MKHEQEPEKETETEKDTKHNTTYNVNCTDGRTVVRTDGMKGNENENER